MKYNYLVVKYQDLVEGIMGVFTSAEKAKETAKDFSSVDTSMIYVVAKLPVNKALNDDYDLEIVAEFLAGVQS